MKQIYLKKTALLITSFALLANVVAVAALPMVASAATLPVGGGTTYTRVNYAVIKDSTGTFWIADASSPNSRPTNKYIKQTTSGTSSDYIQIENPNSGSSSEWSRNLLVYKVSSSTLNGQTTSSSQTGLKANSGNYTEIYYWINKNTIGRYAASADGDDIPSVRYTFDKDSGFFVEPGDCPDRIKVDGSSARMTVGSSTKNESQIFGVFNNGGQPGARFLIANEKAGDSCYLGRQNDGETGAITITLAENKNLKDGENGVGIGGNAGAAETTNQKNDACYSGINVFAWILCPMLDLADGIYGFLRSAVFSLLAIPELTGSSKQDLYESWSTIRNIANALLVVVALFMIVSQIFNFNFVDAYTVKKVLPRLVIAAILIQLSWFVCEILIQIFNALGYGLNTLITAPFTNGAGGDIVDIIDQSNSGAVTSAGIFTGAGLAIGGATIALTALAPGGMITVALIAIGVIVSVLLTILTLVIRKLLIIALVVLAPIAFVLWILPNTQKFWNTWWNLFIRLLIMFPLIALLFAAGQIFASIIVKSSGDAGALEGGLNNIIAIIAYFAPLFLIPATYKFAGGIFASISGFLNNAGGKVRQSGFGLRARKDAYTKLKNEERAVDVAQRARSNMGRALNPDASRFQRVRGRAALGVGGLPGVPGSKKRLEKAQARYGAVSDKQAMDDAALEWNGLTRSASHLQINDLEKAVVNTAVGKQATVSVNDANGIAQQRQVTVTPELKRQALASAAGNKNYGVIDTAAMGASNPSQDPVVAKAQQENLTALDTFLNKDGGFGAVDAIASDVARGNPGSIEQKDVFATGVENFGTQKGDRQERIVQHVKSLADGAVTDASKYGHNGGDVTKQRATAAAIINSFAARSDLSEIDATALAAWNGINIAKAGGGTISAQDIIGSNGNVRVQVDTAGNLVAVSSSDV